MYYDKAIISIFKQILDEAEEEERTENNAVVEGPWGFAPDIVLLQVFSHLTPSQLMMASSVCKSWNRVSYDNMLWKKTFYRYIKVHPHVPMCPGKDSWYCEYKRLVFEVPSMCTDVLKVHSDQVLHVSCSHDGTMFATSSKDGFIKVWNLGEEISYKYGKDMRAFSWNYTQFSEFNRSDTLLLVSGVHFGFTNTTSGEIAVFSLVGGFDLQCRVPNKPYDIFGAWISDRYLLSGDLHCVSNLVSTTGLWISKASQEVESERTPIRSLQYRFHNINASSIRKIMIAETQLQEKPVEHQKRSKEETKLNEAETEPSTSSQPNKCRPLVVDTDVYSDSESEQSDDDDDLSKEPEKLLIFITGCKTYTPHKVGLKRVKNIKFPKKIVTVTIEERMMDILVEQRHTQVNRFEKFDKPDAQIELNGHIIGAALSPDHRYLYVNCRPWPEGCRIKNPLFPPPISSQIDLRVIDLKTFKCVDKLFTSHRAFTCSTECFFIFLDVSHDYVASGAEDKFGYIWDRHYQACIAKYPHNDVVNCVAFSPTDPGILITVSDDNTIKVWRSRENLERAPISYPVHERARGLVFV